jgi:GDP-D-mannose dehydratase
MLEYVCSLAGLKIDDVYEQDERYMRPSDVPFLKGNPSKIMALGWRPEYDWKSLLKEMYENDLGYASL